MWEKERNYTICSTATCGRNTSEQNNNSSNSNSSSNMPPKTSKKATGGGSLASSAPGGRSSASSADEKSDSKNGDNDDPYVNPRVRPILERTADPLHVTDGRFQGDQEPHAEAKSASPARGGGNVTYADDTYSSPEKKPSNPKVPPSTIKKERESRKMVIAEIEELKEELKKRNVEFKDKNPDDIIAEPKKDTTTKKLNALREYRNVLLQLKEKQDYRDEIDELKKELKNEFELIMESSDDENEKTELSELIALRNKIRATLEAKRKKQKKKKKTDDDQQKKKKDEEEKERKRVELEQKEQALKDEEKKVKQEQEKKEKDVEMVAQDTDWEEIKNLNEQLNELSGHVERTFNPDRGRRVHEKKKESVYAQTKTYLKNHLKKAKANKAKADEEARKEEAKAKIQAEERIKKIRERDRARKQAEEQEEVKKKAHKQLHETNSSGGSGDGGDSGDNEQDDGYVTDGSMFSDDEGDDDSDDSDDSDDDSSENENEDNDDVRGFIYHEKYVYHPPHTSREHLIAMKNIIMQEQVGNENKKLPRPYRRLSEFIHVHPNNPKQFALRICWDDWLVLFQDYAQFVEFTRFDEQHLEVSPAENSLLDVFISRSEKPRLDVPPKLLIFASESRWTIEKYASPDVEEHVLNKTKDPSLYDSDPDEENKEESNVTNTTVGGTFKRKANYFAYVLNKLRAIQESIIVNNVGNLDNSREYLEQLKNCLQLDIDEPLPNTPYSIGQYSWSSRGLLYDILEVLTKLSRRHVLEVAVDFAVTISEFIIGYHKKANYHKLGMPWKSGSSSDSPNTPCIHDIFDNFISHCEDENTLNTHTRGETLKKMKTVWEEFKTKYQEETKSATSQNQGNEDDNPDDEQSPHTTYKIKRNWMLEIVKNLESYIETNCQKINFAEVDVFDQHSLLSTSLYTIIKDAENTLEELKVTKQYNEDSNMIGKSGTRQRLLDALLKLEECFVHKIQSLDQVVEPTYYYDDTYNYAIKLADWLHYVLDKYDIRIGTINFGFIAGKLKSNSIWKSLNDSFCEDGDSGFCDGFGLFLSRLKRDYSLSKEERLQIEYDIDNENHGTVGNRVSKIVAMKNENDNVSMMDKIMKKDSYFYLLNVESWLRMFYDGLQLGMEYRFLEDKVMQYLIKKGYKDEKLYDICDQEMEYLDCRFIQKIQDINSSSSTYKNKTRQKKIRSVLHQYHKIRDKIRQTFGNLFVTSSWYNTDIEKLNADIARINARILEFQNNDEQDLQSVIDDLIAHRANLEDKLDKITRYRDMTGEELFLDQKQEQKLFDESKQNKRLNSLIMGTSQGFCIENAELEVLFEDLRKFSEDKETKKKRDTIFQGVIAGYLDLQSAEIYKIVADLNKKHASPIQSVGRFFQKHLNTPQSVYSMFQHPIWTNRHNGKTYTSIKTKIMKSLWCFENIIDGMVDCIEYFVVKKQDEDFLMELHGLWQAFTNDDSISNSETNKDQLYTRLVQRMPRKLKKVKEIFFGVIGEDEGELVHSGDFKHFRVVKLGIPIMNPDTQEMEYPLINMDDNKWYYSCKIKSKPPGSTVSLNQPIHVLREDFNVPQEPQQNGDAELVDTMDAFNSAHKVRIGSWNVACANNLEKPTTEDQYDIKLTNIAKVIHESKCDIVALQELPNDVKLNGVVKTILEIKGDLLYKLFQFTSAEWVMQHSTVFHSRSSLTYEDLQNGGGRQMNGPKEVYAFLYNKNRIQYNHANQEETNRVDDRRRREERFSRLPIISNFTCNKLEFTLCTVHLPPYDKKVKTSQEIKDIFEKVFPELIKEYGNKKSKSAIFLGDFNMCYTIKKGFNPKPEMGTWDPFTNAGYVPCIKACTNVLQTQRFDNIWVHNSFEKLRIVSDDESGYTGVIKVNEIMGRPVITGSSLKEGFKKEVSDHNLVYVDFRIDELMPWSASNIVVS